MKDSNVYARDAWYVVAWSTELEQSKPKAVKVLGEPIVLWYSDDELIAMEDRCPHRLAPLSLGRCEGNQLRCMYHGFKFDKNGMCTHSPGQATPPARAKVLKYPVANKHGWIWVWMGDANKADESLIPECIGPDNDAWYNSTGTLEYDADAYLINRNLLDFSHVPFVHGNSFRTPEEAAEMLPNWEKAERGLKYTSWTKNVMGSPAAPSKTPVDDMLCYDYLMPGIMILKSGHFPVGTANKYDDKRPNYEEVIGAAICSSQAVLPVEKGKTKYFFTIGCHKNFGSPEMQEGLTQVQIAAFAEDKIMIEGQQKIINADPDRPVLTTAHDKAIVLFEQMVKKSNSKDQT